MARRVTSPVFVGRAGELAGLLAAVEAASDGHSSMTLIDGEAGIGKSRLVAELVAGVRDRGQAGEPAATEGRAASDGSAASPGCARPRRRVRPARRERAAVRADRRGAPVAGRAGPRRGAGRRARALGGRARPARPGAVGPRRARDLAVPGGRLAPGADLRGLPRPARAAGRVVDGRPRDRGPPLVGSVDPGPARIPRAQLAGRTAGDRRDDPDRRPPARSPAPGLAGRDGATPAGRAAGAHPVRPRGGRQPARGDPRQCALAGPGRLRARSVGWQSVLRRGDRRGRR